MEIQRERQEFSSKNLQDHTPENDRFDADSSSGYLDLQLWVSVKSHCFRLLDSMEPPTQIASAAQ